MKSATLTASASADGASEAGASDSGALLSAGDEQATSPINSAGIRNLSLITSTFCVRKKGLLEALRLRGHDGLGKRIAQHAHVLRCLAVSIGRRCCVAAALGIDDRLGGEYVSVRSVTAWSCTAMSSVATPVV